jgi:putative spermidine/putrescine transport system permease protein
MGMPFLKKTSLGDMILTRYPHVRYLAFTLPILIVLLVLFVFPISKIIIRSFMDPGFTLKHYLHILHTPVYFRILFITFRIAFFVTVVCLFAGYPVAYLLSKLPPRKSNLLMIFVMLPFWTSLLVRSYAWMVLLQREGILNMILMKLGLISTPIKMMFNPIGVTVGMVHILLPFMILPLLAVMKGIDRNLLKAAENLGARPSVAWWKVFFPLSLPGVGAGCLLVFMMGIGFFITPSLLGGRTDTMISMAIEAQVNDMVNWGLASALAVVLLGITIFIFIIYDRILGLDRMWGEI